METRVSIDARVLRRYSEGEALAFVDSVLGPPESWSPSLIAYRLSSDFQADWKCEVGNWLLLARDCGFLSRLVHRTGRARHEASNPAVTGPNDSAHRILAQELAPAMVAHYFLGQGWRFVDWEPSTPGGDVDVRLQTPSGLAVDIQVKAPDQPGELVAGRIVGGEKDDRVLRAIDKAMTQLKTSSAPARIVAVSPQRTWSIQADVLACHLLGTAVSRTDDIWGICRDGAGTFGSVPGSGVSAVVDLDLIRGLEATLYRCTVICNPWVVPGGVMGAECFPHARVLSLRGDTFVWEPEEPNRCFRFPTGMRCLTPAAGV
jgi:hypothetical protein